MIVGETLLRTPPLTCQTVDQAIAQSLVVNRAFSIENDADVTHRLTTTALVNGRRVDLSSVLRWDRGEWSLQELFVGGAAVPMLQE